MTKQSFLQMKTNFCLRFPTDIYDNLHMVKLDFVLLERCKLIMSKNLVFNSHTAQLELSDVTCGSSEVMAYK